MKMKFWKKWWENIQTASKSQMWFISFLSDADLSSLSIFSPGSPFFSSVSCSENQFFFNFHRKSRSHYSTHKLSAWNFSLEKIRGTGWRYIKNSPENTARLDLGERTYICGASVWHYPATYSAQIWRYLSRWWCSRSQIIGRLEI